MAPDLHIYVEEKSEFHADDIRDWDTDASLSYIIKNSTF